MYQRRILIVDDHPFFRVGLSRILQQDDRLKIVAEATNGHEALHEADVHRPDLVLMDVHLPGVTGLQVGAALRRQRPSISLIFLSMHVDDDRLFAAIRAGAAGYLTKDADPQAILDAVHAVLGGETSCSSKCWPTRTWPAGFSASSDRCTSKDQPRRNQRRGSLHGKLRCLTA